MMNQTAHEIINRLAVPDLARDSVAEQHNAVVAENEGFAWNDAESNGHWRALLPPVLPEIRHLTEVLREQARAAFAADLSGELPYGAEIVSDYQGVTVAPSNTPTPPGPVPVVLFRSSLTGGPTIERHYAFGSVTLPDIAAQALESARKDRGCDLRLITPAGLHDSITRKSSRFIWPIACGEHLVILNYCSECIGAMFRDYQVKKSQIVTPWNLG